MLRIGVGNGTTQRMRWKSWFIQNAQKRERTLNFVQRACYLVICFIGLDAGRYESMSYGDNLCCNLKQDSYVVAPLDLNVDT